MAMILVLASCASTPAAVGAWNVEGDIQGNPVQLVLTIEEDGTGVLGFGQLGEMEIDGIVLNGNSINFESSVDMQGFALDIAFNGMVDGDTLTGQLESSMFSTQLTGTRQ